MKTRPSKTAQGIAFARALESSKPADERICYDPLARQLIRPAFYLLGRLFVGLAERKAPGAIGFLVARCRYMDDVLRACLEEGLDQLVILGAGLDSRAYRFEQLREQVHVFEVDRPATKQAKIKKLRKILGGRPEHVTYVPIDFEEETLEKLFDVGYSARAKTLFIWEGVVHYLTAEAVDQTLAFVQRNAGPGSSIIFDYVYKRALTAAEKRGEVVRMQRAQPYTGEALIFGIEESQVEAFLRARGYTQVQDVTSEELKKRYFTGVNQDRAIAPIYSIVNAAVGG